MIHYSVVKRAFRVVRVHSIKGRNRCYGIVFFSLLTAATALSQNLLTQKISFSCRDMSPTDALHLFSDQTGVAIAFSASFFEKCPPISIDASDREFQEVLARITRCAPVSWKLIGTQVALFRKVNYYTLNGYLSDAQTGERLIGATLRLWNSEKTGAAATNEFGFFSLTLPEGDYQLLCSYVGCEEHRATLSLHKNTWLDLKLASSSALPEITISASNNTAPVSGKTAASPELDLESLPVMPSPGGEPDLFKLAALEAGVTSGIDGLGGLHIRGGNADQNLILLDDVPVYSPGHAFGMFSVFNPATIKSIKLWKGDAPANFGGRAASAFDIRTRDGDMQRHHGAISAGLFAGTATLEGPLERGESAFLVSARSTWLSPWLRLYEKKSNARYLPDTGITYRFYDINLKFNKIISEKDRIYLGLYRGGDSFGLASEVSYADSLSVLGGKYEISNRWGNFTGSLRWNHVFSPRLFSNTTFTASDFQLSSGRLVAFYNNSAPNVPPEFSFRDSSSVVSLFRTRVRDLSIKTDLSYFANRHLTLRSGLGLTTHRFQPGVLSGSSSSYYYDSNLESFSLVLNDTSLRNTEPFLYSAVEWTDGRRWSVQGGLHAAAMFSRSGNFFSLQPRFSASRALWRGTSLSFSAARMTQFLHQIGTQNAGIQAELWAPASRRIPPEHSWLLSTGLAGDHSRWMWSVAAYWRTQTNLANFIRTDNLSALQGAANVSGWESGVTAGRGWSVGLELTLKKQWRSGSIHLSYTLSRTRRQFDRINFGREFPFRFDRPHDFKMSVVQRLNKWLDASLVWAMGSGLPVTLSKRKFLNQDSGDAPTLIWGGPIDEITAFNSVNGFRLPAYSHFDAALNARFQVGNTLHMVQAGVYNAFDRGNFFAAYVVRSNPYDTDTRIMGYTLLPVLPVFRYEVAF